MGDNDNNNSIQKCAGSNNKTNLQITQRNGLKMEEGLHGYQQFIKT